MVTHEELVAKVVDMFKAENNVCNLIGNRALEHIIKETFEHRKREIQSGSVSEGSLHKFISEKYPFLRQSCYVS